MYSYYASVYIVLLPVIIIYNLKIIKKYIYNYCFYFERKSFNFKVILKKKYFFNN